jgi:AAA+ ATPase superfamily predicted ATPase
VLRSLALGAREWAEVLAWTPDLASGGQLAPYLAKLQQLGLVEGEGPLDARPGARSRRYRLVDPFLGFWHRFVLPHLSQLAEGQAQKVWRQHVRPHLDEYAAQLFPIVCRQYLERHSEHPLLGRARTLGGLWGDGYDIDPAGTLRTGAAFYGKTFWERGRITEIEDENLQEEMRGTRYGFGKEARLRLLFSTGGFSPGLLRRGARSDVMHLISTNQLF